MQAAKHNSSLQQISCKKINDLQEALQEIQKALKADDVEMTPSIKLRVEKVQKLLDDFVPILTNLILEFEIECLAMSGIINSDSKTVKAKEITRLLFDNKWANLSKLKTYMIYQQKLSLILQLALSRQKILKRHHCNDSIESYSSPNYWVLQRSALPYKF